MGSVCIFFGENILLLLFYCYSSPVPFGGRFHARMKICLQKGTNGASELQHFEKVVDKRYSGAIQYDQVEKLSTHKIRQDVFRKEDVLPSPHKDSIPADFVSAGFLLHKKVRFYTMLYNKKRSARMHTRRKGRWLPKQPRLGAKIY